MPLFGAAFRKPSQNVPMISKLAAEPLSHRLRLAKKADGETYGRDNKSTAQTETGAAAKGSCRKGGNQSHATHRRACVDVSRHAVDPTV